MVIITADHGNAECMILDDGSPMAAHTTNPAPVVVRGMGETNLIQDGKLCDLAPTFLETLGIEQPNEMTVDRCFRTKPVGAKNFSLPADNQGDPMSDAMVWIVRKVPDEAKG